MRSYPCDLSWLRKVFGDPKSPDDPLMAITSGQWVHHPKRRRPIKSRLSSGQRIFNGLSTSTHNRDDSHASIILKSRASFPTRRTIHVSYREKCTPNCLPKYCPNHQNCLLIPSHCIRLIQFPGAILVWLPFTILRASGDSQTHSEERINLYLFLFVFEGTSVNIFNKHPRFFVPGLTAACWVFCRAIEFAQVWKMIISRRTGECAE